MTADQDLVIVGLGALGSATACWAAQRPGRRVLALEQFQIGHDRGASEDVSRIIRRSYHRGDYVRLTAGAYDAWSEVERASGRRVVVRTGGLDLGPAEPAAGVAIDLRDYAAAMAAQGVPFEQLDAPEIMRRWPAWRLDEEHAGLFQPDAGLADPSAGNAAHRGLAVEHGAELRAQARVVALEPRDGETVVVLEDGTRIAAGAVVVAADAWTSRLLEPLGVHLPLTITQEQVAWFTPRTDPDAFAPERFPIWIWMDEPSFYGFPAYGFPGPKVGQDVGGRPVTPETRTFDPDPDVEARVIAFLAARLPDMAGTPFRTRTCLYTLTRDRDFVVDRVPGAPGVQVVLGAAHAYKFASLLGRILAERAFDGTSPWDPELAAFGVDRPALTDTGFAPAFVV